MSVPQSFFSNIRITPFHIPRYVFIDATWTDYKFFISIFSPTPWVEFLPSLSAGLTTIPCICDNKHTIINPMIQSCFDLLTQVCTRGLQTEWRRSSILTPWEDQGTPDLQISRHLDTILVHILEFLSRNHLWQAQAVVPEQRV